VLDITVGAKPTAPKSITTKHLAYELAERNQLTKQQGLEFMEDLIGMIVTHLTKGERVKLVGLGILQVRNLAARMGRNPGTGAAIQIKPSKKVVFRSSKELKEAVLMSENS
jgi:DNA-binding protein HU-beta